MKISLEESEEAWNGYEAALNGIGVRQIAAEFQQKKYAHGVLPSSLCESVRHIIERAQRIPFRGDNVRPRAVVSNWTKKSDEIVNRENFYLRLDATQLWALYDIIDHLREPISQCLGGNWTVLTCRSWITPNQEEMAQLMGPQTPEQGSFQWHYDGEPNGIFKVMIYLTPIGEDLGGIKFMPDYTSIVEMAGPAGCWLLFYNSVLKHVAVPPTRPAAHRTAVEMTIAPWPSMRARPVVLGHNARHPALPLIHTQAVW